MAHTNFSLSFKEVDLRNAWHAIENASHIVLLPHFKPDGDAMSSCAAFEKALHIHSPTKKITTIYPSEPDYLPFHSPSHVLINTHKETPDLLIAFDTANYDRLYYPPSFQSIPLINIDHHISNSIQGTYNFVDAQISSTCELLYYLLQIWNVQLINKEISEALLFGIVCDTLTFSIQNIAPHTLRAAANLIEKGANLYEVKHRAFPKKNPNVVALWGHLLSSIEYSAQGKAAYRIVSQEELKQRGLTIDAIGGFNNFVASILSTDVVIIGYEMEEGIIKLSFRSKTVDVNKIASSLGGGGHIYASGALLTGSVIDATNKIKAICENL